MHGDTVDPGSLPLERREVAVIRPAVICVSVRGFVNPHYATLGVITNKCKIYFCRELSELYFLVATHLEELRGRN